MRRESEVWARERNNFYFFLLLHLSFCTVTVFRPQSPLLSFCSFGPLFFPSSYFSPLLLLTKIAAELESSNVQSVGWMAHHFDPEWNISTKICAKGDFLLFLLAVQQVQQITTSHVTHGKYNMAMCINNYLLFTSGLESMKNTLRCLFGPINSKMRACSYKYMPSINRGAQVIALVHMQQMFVYHSLGLRILGLWSRFT